MKDIYLLYSCDIWKSKSTMRLEIATTDIAKLKRKIIREIEMDNMNVVEKDYKSFILNNPPHEINIVLDNGYIDVVEDGEDL